MIEKRISFRNFWAIAVLLAIGNAIILFDEVLRLALGFPHWNHRGSLTPVKVFGEGRVQMTLYEVKAGHPTTTLPNKGGEGREPQRGTPSGGLKNN